MRRLPRRVSSFFFRSIPGRITLLIAVVLSLAACLVSWLILQSYRNERRALERHLISATRATTLLVEGALAERQALLGALATSGNIQRRDFARFRAQALGALPARDEWVVLTDLTGQQQVNTRLPAEAVLPGAPLPEDLIAAMRAGRPYVSPLSTASESPGSVLFTAIPIREDGALKFTLAVSVTPAAFDPALKQGGAAAGWSATIVDQEGRLAARNRRAEEFVGRKAGPLIMAAMAAAKEGVIESVTLDGVKSITAFTRSERLGWTIVIAAPSAELFASAERLLGTALVGSLVLGLGATLVAAWLGRRVVSAVNTLVEEAGAIGRGEVLADERTGLHETDIIHRALQDASARLAARERELTQANASLRHAAKAKDDFLAALSHELRTPLNPVLLIASDAAEDPAYPVAARQAFNLIAKNASLEARLIDDLLDLTRITRGKLSLDLQRLDVHRVLREAIETVRADLEVKKQQLTVQLAPGAVGLDGDATRLQQVFWNVLKNAVKFTPAGGRVSVGTRVIDRTLEVEISDSGLGMTAEEITRVFEPFSQGDHASGSGAHRFGGLGLGLAITRRLVELHGGTIDAASEGRGRGARFRLVLPLSEVDSSKPPSATPPAVETAAEAAAGEGQRLLVVEDHDATRVTVERLLTRRHYRVKAAPDATEALRLAAEHRFDWVISDIGLPGEDGYSLMRRLKELHGLRGIALSGYGMEKDIDRGREAGFLAHLTKPVDIRQLEAVLAKLSAGGDASGTPFSH